MAYEVNGVELENDGGYLLEPNYSDRDCSPDRRREGLAMNDERWAIVNYMREQYKEHGHTPTFRNMLKDWEKIRPAPTAIPLHPVSRNAGQTGCQGSWPAQPTQGRILTSGNG